jgi:hypothetical protein
MSFFDHLGLASSYLRFVALVIAVLPAHQDLDIRAAL